MCTPKHHESNGVVENFMKNLTKIRRIANLTGKHYMPLVKNFLAQYRNTPHCSTGKAPSSLIFRYNAHHSRLPRNENSSIIKSNDQKEAEHLDKQAKHRMKNYKDNDKSKFKEFKVDDEVRVRISEKQSKNKPPLTVETYTVKEINGTQLKLIRKDGSGRVLIRDTNDVEHILKSGQVAQIEIDDDCQLILEVPVDRSRALTVRYDGSAIRFYRGGMIGKERGRGGKD